jgi:hypothetical protein
MPTKKEIKDENDYCIKVPVKETMANELNCFKELLKNKNIDVLISRYPIKESPVIDSILKI